MDSPEHWKQERLPGGTIRWYLHADKPVSLPHHRHPLAHEFVIRWWMASWLIFVLACVGLAVYFGTR